MDKTIEIIIAATVLVMAAVSIMFMFSGQAGDFGTWLDNQQSNASCDLSKAKFKQACQCEPDKDYSEAHDQIRPKAADKGCSWAQGPNKLSCNEIC